MKYRYMILPTLLALMSVASSCNQEELPLAMPENTVIDITAQIGSPATRVTETSDNVYSFDKNDSVAVVGWYGADWNDHPAPWATATDKWWINSLCVNTGSKWVATPQMRWQNVDAPHHFLAWWPYGFVSSGANLSDVKFDLDTLKVKDILVARKSTEATPGIAVPFVFNHIFSRLDVNVVFGGQYSNITDVKLTFDAVTKGTLNLVADGGAAVSLASAVTTTSSLDKIATVAEADYSCSSIILPQASTDMSFSIDFKVDGVAKSLTYVHPSFLFESGKRTTLNLNVGKDYVKVLGVTVTPWEDGGKVGTDNLID